MTIPLFPLFLVFLVLKLTKTVAWSWWIITAPLWFLPTLFLGVLFLYLFIAFIKVMRG